MPINFYYTPGSPPCRAVMMAAKAIGVTLNLKLTNLMKGDHLKPEFIKINPQHSVPTMDDNGFVLCESRAMLGYMVDQYGKNDILYPKDAKKRALVDQRLYFDIGTLYQRFSDYYFPFMFAGGTADPAKYVKIEEAFTFLEKFLEGQDWVAGSNMTIADISLVAGVSTAEVVGFEVTKYPNVAKWLARSKKSIVNYDGLNSEGIAQFKDMYDKVTSGKK